MRVVFGHCPRRSSTNQSICKVRQRLSKRRRRLSLGPFRALHRRSSGPGSRVAGMPEMGLLGVDPGRGGPLAHAQAGALVGTEEVPELEVVVARQALEPAPEVAP